MDDVMLDLETMGNTGTSAIIAIGAVRFGNGVILDKFHTTIDLESSMGCGLTIDASTIIWWMQQSEVARAVFKNATASLHGALHDFGIFVCDDDRVWGNGAAFDNAILSNAYKVADIEQPWKFWNDRCYRTIKNMYPNIKMKRVGTHHNAVDDAESQALHLMEIIEYMEQKDTVQLTSCADRYS